MRPHMTSESPALSPRHYHPVLRPLCQSSDGRRHLVPRSVGKANIQERPTDRHTYMYMYMLQTHAIKVSCDYHMTHLLLSREKLTALATDSKTSGGRSSKSPRTRIHTPCFMISSLVEKKNTQVSSPY